MSDWCVLCKKKTNQLVTSKRCNVVINQTTFYDKLVNQHWKTTQLISSHFRQLPISVNWQRFHRPTVNLQVFQKCAKLEQNWHLTIQRTIWFFCVSTAVLKTILTGQASSGSQKDKNSTTRLSKHITRHPLEFLCLLLWRHHLY